jgi:hypothetical protein|tara:strand:- start:226 stop:1017 length:792 start_codon:yes stop_codon:yes gene_type:complete
MFVHGSANGFVKITLCRVEVNGMNEDGFGRELGGDLVFGSAKDERAEASAKESAALFVVVFFDGVLVVATEAFERAEEAGHEEAEERPEFTEVVFDRSAGEAEAVAGTKFAGGLTDLGGGVFDVLCFVEGNELEFVFFKLGDIALQKGKGGEDDVRVGDVGKKFSSLRAVQDDDLQRWRESFSLGKPVGNDRGGSNDENRPTYSGILEAEDVGEGLEGFSEAHVVGKDAIEFVIGEEPYPISACLLVVTEVGLQALGRGKFLW